MSWPARLPALLPSKVTAFCLLVVCLATAKPPALAQMDMTGQTMETKDEMPPDQLPVPQKLTGIGNAHIQITATPEAQMWFDQGLNLIHDYWDYESARAFEQSVRVDPRCAMCYWGLYKAESFYHSTAQGYAGQALAKAVSLKGHEAIGSAFTSRPVPRTKMPRRTPSLHQTSRKRRNSYASS
jgi:hypothetical protein